MGRWCATGGHQLDGFVHVGDVYTQVVETFPVLVSILHIDIGAGNLLHPLEGSVARAVPAEPHLESAGLAAIDAVEADVVVDARKGFEAEPRIVGAHFSHVVHDPGEMVDLSDGVLVAGAGGVGRARLGIRVINQRQSVSPALRGGVEICDPAPARTALPGILNHYAHAF